MPPKRRTRGAKRRENQKKKPVCPPRAETRTRAPVPKAELARIPIPNPALGQIKTTSMETTTTANPCKQSREENSEGAFPEGGGTGRAGGPEGEGAGADGEGGTEGAEAAGEEEDAARDGEEAEEEEEAVGEEPRGPSAPAWPRTSSRTFLAAASTRMPLAAASAGPLGLKPGTKAGGRFYTTTIRTMTLSCTPRIP